MSCRSQTPVPRVRVNGETEEEEGAATVTSVTIGSSAVKRNFRRMQSLGTTLRSPKIWRDLKSKRRFTDLCVLFICAVFGTILFFSYERSLDGRPERLTHGFDYRGRMCGIDSQVNATYLLWCTPANQDMINWADPICVSSCPTSSEQTTTVMCPLPKIEKEIEVPGPNQSFRLVKTVEQNVVPSPATSTHALFSYCIPDVLLDTDMNTITQMFEGAGFGGSITHLRHYGGELVQRWKLLVVAIFFACFFAYTYLVLLRMVARPLIYLSFFLILIFAALCTGYCFVKSKPIVWGVMMNMRELGPVQWAESTVFVPFVFPYTKDLASDIRFAANEIRDVAEDVLPDALVNSSKKMFSDVRNSSRKMLSDVANSSNPVLEKLTAEVKAKSAVLKNAVTSGFARVPSFMKKRFNATDFSLESIIRPLVGSYTMHALFSLGVFCSLLCYILLCLLVHSRKTIHLAIGCVEEACSVLFSIKTLLILPFLQLVAWCTITAIFSILILQVLSTIPVTADSITIAGIEVQGFARQFHPTMYHAVQSLMWLFALFWVQELAHVFVHFVASYAAVQWFFSSFDGYHKRAPYFLVPKGFFIGAMFHLGSLALVAFLAASLRAIRWIWFFTSKRKKEERGRFMASITNSIDCCLRLCESFIHYISSHILTEIALNGDKSFCSCAASVGSLLATNVTNAAMLHGTGWLLTIVGTLSIAAATSGSMVLAIRNPDIINIDALKDLDGADANLFAIVGAVLGGFIGYAFMSLLDRVAETLMYVYLRCKDDGSMANTPDSLVRLVDAHEIVEM